MFMYLRVQIDTEDYFNAIVKVVNDLSIDTMPCYHLDSRAPFYSSGTSICGAMFSLGSIQGQNRKLSTRVSGRPSCEDI